MEYRNQTWSVVCTARAPEHIINSFIKHYASLNPDKIYIFFDDAQFASYDQHIAPGKVIPFICDDSYWATVPKIPPTKNPGVRPDGVEIRQHTNMLYAREIMSSDWLLHVDSDELVRTKRTVASVLSELPEHVFSVCLKNYEAVYTKEVEIGGEFDTPYFKRYLPNREVLAKYYAPELINFSRGGFWGVETGKSFVRKSPVVFKMSVHRPVPFDTSLISNIKTNDLELLHFEGQSYDLFKEKSFLRSRKKVATLMPDRFSHRLEKIEQVYAAHGDAGLRRLYNDFYVMSERKIEAAISDGFVQKKPFKSESNSKYLFAPSINPLEEERNQQLSLWQGTILRTFHNSYLAFDNERGHVVGASIAQLTRLTSMLPIEIAFINETEAMLFYRNFSEMSYLAAPINSSLQVTSFKRDATIFSISSEMDTRRQFALRTDMGYLRTSPNGEVRVNSSEPREWEMLYPKVIYPQL